MITMEEEHGPRVYRYNQDTPGIVHVQTLHRKPHPPKEYFFLIDVDPQWVHWSDHSVETNVKLSVWEMVHEGRWGRTECLEDTCKMTYRILCIYWIESLCAYVNPPPHPSFAFSPLFGLPLSPSFPIPLPYLVPPPTPPPLSLSLIPPGSLSPLSALHHIPSVYQQWVTDEQLNKTVGWVKVDV